MIVFSINLFNPFKNLNMTNQSKLSISIIALCLLSVVETTFYYEFSKTNLKIGGAILCALLIVFFCYEISRLIKDIS